MNNFFEIFDLKFHLLLLASGIISIGFGKYAKLRLSNSMNMFLNWNKKPSLWFKFLIVEDSLFLSAQIGIAVFSSIAYSWWFGLIIIIEYMLVVGILLGFLQKIISASNSAWTLIKSIGLIVDFFLLIFYLNNLEYSVAIFGISFPFWVFMLAFGLPRGIFGIISLLIDLITATIITPVVVVFITIWYQNRKTIKDAKTSLFLNLMAHRVSVPITQEWVDALNQIDAVFQDNKKVINAWRAYFESLHKNDTKNSTSTTYQIELLSEISKDLGFGNLKLSQIADFYSPKQFSENLETQKILSSELIRVLRNSHSYSESLNQKKNHK